MNSIRALVAALVFLAACTRVPAEPAAVELTIDPATRHQTILAWGKTTPWLPAAPLLREITLQRAVDDLGLNRLRFEGVAGNGQQGRSWEWLNDNDDPHQIHWPAFNTARIDQRATDWLLPWKQAVEARGESFDFYVSPSFFRDGSSGAAPPWLIDDPEEYAEWAGALLLHLRERHGLTAGWFAICNEAGYENAFTTEVVARLIPAVAARFGALGLPTRIQFPESVNAHEAVRYIESIRGRDDLWPHIGLISYHWYSRDNQVAMARLRELAAERGLPTAQTEFMQLTIDHLYADLTIGGTSVWEVYGLCTPDYRAAIGGASSETIKVGDWYWRFGQLTRHVRPGAVRIGCSSSDPAVRALAFEHGGRPTVVLIGGAAEQRARLALPPGRYGLSQAVGQRPSEELGPRLVARDARLEVAVPADAVVTIYPRGEANLPPMVTVWRPQPAYLTTPAAALRLEATATDPDGEQLAYRWSLVSAPAGAAPRLAEPAAASTPVTGLDRAGDYVFAVTVSDAEHSVTRRLLARVFAGNQPPQPMDVHNRNPVQPRADNGRTILRAGAFDLEGDPVRFTWRLLAQPPGARAVLETPDNERCPVTGMTRPGDYRFAVDVSDGEQTVTVEHTVPVQP